MDAEKHKSKVEAVFLERHANVLNSLVSSHFGERIFDRWSFFFDGKEVITLKKKFFSNISLSIHISKYLTPGKNTFGRRKEDTLWEIKKDNKIILSFVADEDEYIINPNKIQAKKFLRIKLNDFEKALPDIKDAISYAKKLESKELEKKLARRRAAEEKSRRQKAKAIYENFSF